MPGQFALLRPRSLQSGVLNLYRSHLNQHWSEEEIDQAEEDQNVLSRVRREEPTFKLQLQKHDMKTMFNKALDDFNGRFKSLRDFVAGLAAAFPSTASVETDNSTAYCEFNNSRTAFSNLILAGICQSKQRKFFVVFKL